MPRQQEDSAVILIPGPRSEQTRQECYQYLHRKYNEFRKKEAEEQAKQAEKPA